jgi:[ribosomal protein S18]-alanine N-acetyltransferase
VITPQSLVELRFRRMRLEDVEQVYAIDVLSFALPWSERSYRYEINENQSSRNWVAEGADSQGHTQIVGMIVTWIILDEAHVATIAVHPDFRHLGIGRQLLAHALLDTAQEGAVQAFLEVRASNLAAQALYRQFGFEVNGLRPRYYLDNNENALLMMLSPIDVARLRSILAHSQSPSA